MLIERLGGNQRFAPQRLRPLAAYGSALEAAHSFVGA
jgi:hypothetical protein